MPHYYYGPGPSPRHVYEPEPEPPANNSFLPSELFPHQQMGMGPYGNSAMQTRGFLAHYQPLPAPPMIYMPPRYDPNVHVQAPCIVRSQPDMAAPPQYHPPTQPAGLNSTGTSINPAAEPFTPAAPAPEAGMASEGISSPDEEGTPTEDGTPDERGTPDEDGIPNEDGGAEGSENK
ncbi:hypothetical protein B0H67DRAFT_570027 [Lasiosphaeris hirsuta]|uniref:Uncharacterized protein n=1 Tax=Lasiosphaeris hirsuta TaxID=260670 RepID=A0AA40E5Z6_9PEZI|nr:hypothetical protein B0H67DRAFT_570027 [Lasiosphaeris hirsuta]